MPEPFSHRSSLKQSNKPFKSKHASKGALKAKAKGKLGTESSTNATIRRKVDAHKADRRNSAKLMQQKKREDIVSAHRLFSGSRGISKVIAVVPLCPDVNVDKCISQMFESVSQPIVQNQGTLLLNLERFKQKLQFIPTSRHLLEILDAVKVADMVIFLLSSEEEVDSFGELCLTTIKTQGVPSCISFVQHLEANNTPKKQLDVRKSLIYYMEHHFPGEHKLFSSENESECVKALRHITSQRPKAIHWRDRHSYVIADKVEFDDDESSLKVTGFIRGSALSANHLVHITNHGDFQIEKIVSCPLPGTRTDMMVDSTQVIHSPDPNVQESLISENEPDPMDGEQTWPTEEEIMNAEINMTKKTKRVPKGTSSYQAAWIVDSGDENESELDPHEMNDDQSANWENMHFEAEAETMENLDNESDQDEYEEVELENKETAFDATLDKEQEEKDLQEYLDKKRKSEAEDMQFPDEVDTPLNSPARIRFQKYRGLKSFRTSPWDPYENLPLDYSRIFQFQNFKLTRKKIFDAIGSEGAPVGSYVTIYVKNVPRNVLDTLTPSSLFSLFSLLPYEHKMSTVNFIVQRQTEYNDPVKSKDPVILMSGFRRFIVNPIYSSHSRGGSNNVHKFERFLQKGRSSVGTIYAPIQFGPCPILMFKYSPDSCISWTPESTVPLIATGSLMDMDPTRIIAKRIVLTGHPFKVHKRGATVRFMFFSPEDVNYFKPVQLSTKMGRVGHIKESLGTHGYMKCVFDGPLKGQDTICMNLYKRVYPKWTTEIYSHEISNHDKEGMLMDTE